MQTIVYCCCMCKDTYVPHKFLFQTLITYLMYIIVIIFKVNRVAEKKIHLKNVSYLQF